MPAAAKPAPTDFEFSEADFGPPDTSLEEFTEADFSPARPKITLSPYQKQRMDVPMGPFGPVNPQEVLALPDVLKAPAAALEQSQILPKIQEAMGISMRSLGLDPDVIKAEPPGPNLSQPPTPLEEAFPKFTAGLNTAADKMAAGLLDPTLAVTMPFKPVQALMGAGALAAIPENVAQMARSKSPQELGEATGETLANLGMGVAIGGHLLPRASRLAAETLTEKGAPNARRFEEATEVHGNLQPPAEQGPGQMPAQESGAGVRQETAPLAQQTPLPLTAEELSYIDAERSALDVPVEISQEPLSGNEPFAGMIATIDRAQGTVKINGPEFSKWLNTVPSGQRAQAVRSLLSEERIHLAVDDGSAASYWGNLTSLEKAIERRRYTGQWRGLSNLSDIDMGHEALRFRLQQLARVTPREIAEAAGREKWTVKAITALENIARGLRDTFATKASVEQLEILDRIQENLKAARLVATGGAPSAIRKKRDEGPELFLPPVTSGSQVERHVFPVPSAVAIEKAADQHFGESFLKGEIPSFEAFHNELRGQYGSGVTRDAVWYAWQDGMTKRLMSAKGSKIHGLMDKLSLRKDVAIGLDPGMTDPGLKGAIPDPFLPARGAQSLIPEIGRVSKKAQHQIMDPPQRRRLAAIGAILDKLTKEAGPKPEKPWLRSEIGPEDIGQQYVVGNPMLKGADLGDIASPEIETRRLFRRLNPQEAASPAKLGEIATAGAAVDATGKGAPPRTVSKNLIALRDRSGRIILVSTWRDPRSGPRITDPGAANLPSRKIDQALLEQYTPVAVMGLREPAQGMRQVFGSEAEFAKWFGDAGIEGTPGIKTSSFTGPQAGIIESQAGIRGAGTPPPAEAGLPPEFTEKDFESPTATELSTPVRAPVPAGRALYRSPRPEPPLAEKLPPAQQRVIEALAAEAFPETQSGISEPNYGKPTGRITEVGKPAPMGPGWPLRAGIEGTVTGRRTPAALSKQAVKDGFELLGRSLAASVARKAVSRRIPAMIDAAEGNAAAAASNARLEVENASFSDLPAGITANAKKNLLRENTVEAAKRRNAAIVYIASGFTDARGNWRARINRIDRTIPSRGARPSEPSFVEYLNRAEARASMWLNDPNPLKRSEGRKDLKYVAQMREVLDYARAHWNDPKFIQTAQAARKELSDAIQFETANGFPTTEHENYIPGRYEGSFWNDNLIRFAARKLLGTRFGAPKTFKNPFEAISVGPYRMAQTDMARLVEHRVAQGRKRVEMDVAIHALRNLVDPTSGQPVAKSPVAYIVTDPATGVQTIKYKSPSPDYELIYPRQGSPPLAVRDAFAKLVKTVTAPSRIEELPFAKGLLVANQMLKHGSLLLLDTFHGGRIAQYAQALMGRQLAGWRGGYTALSYRPAQLADAVAKGLVSHEAAHWASELIDIGRGVRLTRQQILARLTESGLNAQRLTDALYRTAIEHVPIVGGSYHKLISPFNELMFQRFIPGLMAETALSNFERMRKANPGVPLSELTRDIVTDTNVFFGNLGRQGVLKSKTAQQLAQIALLAPGWQEGLFQKEIRFYARLGGGAARLAGMDLPYRRGLPAMGMLGQGMSRGLVTYLVATQLINLVTKGQPTWKNEKGHQLDAWLPTPWDRTSGVWLSPLSVYAEITHDLVRLLQSKPKAWDAIDQMGENRLSPVGKMLLVLATGKSPGQGGQHYSTTAGVLGGAASQVVPFVGASPITFSVPSRAIGHALLPNTIAPNQPGATMRQALSTLTGTKTELERTPIQRMQDYARDFVQREGLQKSTGWQEVQTDEPSYSKLRSALRLGDVRGSKIMLGELRKNHTDSQIEHSMKLWSKRAWTGSTHGDHLMRSTMSDEQGELMSQADQDRMELLNQFYDLILSE